METHQITSTILQIVLILSFAKVLGEVAERLGQPSVLGELVAGVLLGASVLGWIKTSDSITLLAELGVILLLFEIGLESDIGDFLKVGACATAVAVTGVVGPFAAGYGICLLLGLNHTVSIFVGATLTATSIGITARTLKDLGASRSREAQIIIGAAVADDIIGLVILAIITGIAQGTGMTLWPAVRTSLLAVILLAGAILASIPIAPYVLKIVNRLRTRGMLTVSAFGFCLLMAYFADRLHLATIVGAFAAGLVLARTEDQARIQVRIKPLADIFVPIFFVSLGLTVDISALNPLNPAARSTIVFVALIATVAVLFKILSGYVIPRMPVSRAVIGIGMVPRGEVGLIFASIGLSRGIITQDLYAALLAVIFITTFITPPLLKAAISKKMQTSVHQHVPSST